LLLGCQVFKLMLNAVDCHRGLFIFSHDVSFNAPPRSGGGFPLN
jgi:hypothetical protein